MWRRASRRAARVSCWLTRTGRCWKSGPATRSSKMDLVADATGNATSLRVRGLEVARVEGQISPRIYFGLEGSYQKLDRTISQTSAGC